MVKRVRIPPASERTVEPALRGPACRGFSVFRGNAKDLRLRRLRADVDRSPAIPKPVVKSAVTSMDHEVEGASPSVLSQST